MLKHTWIEEMVVLKKNIGRKKKQLNEKRRTCIVIATIGWEIIKINYLEKLVTMISIMIQCKPM